MIEVTEAQALILARITPWSSETVTVEASADRVLREDVVAERDQPPFDRVMMDGIAIAYRDWVGGRLDFESAGVQGAGEPPLAVSGAGQCVQVMTGAMLPGGADTVVPVEQITFDGPLARISHETSLRERQHIHPRGSDAPAGKPLLRAGERVGPAEIAVLATAGRATVRVSAVPRVAVISTGDELVEVGEPIARHQIRSCNDLTVAASLSRHRLAQVTRVRLKDDELELSDALQRLHDEHDALILSGGVSMGQFDYVPGALERLNATAVFHRIRQRPGRPMWFGVSRQHKPIFALPGNPVSTLVCTARYVLPAFRHASGIESADGEWVQLGSDVDAPTNLTYFLAVKLHYGTGGIEAEPRPTNSSGDFISLAGTDGFVELAPRRATYTAGSVVRLYRW